MSALLIFVCHKFSVAYVCLRETLFILFLYKEAPFLEIVMFFELQWYYPANNHISLNYIQLQIFFKFTLWHFLHDFIFLIQKYIYSLISGCNVLFSSVSQSEKTLEIQSLNMSLYLMSLTRTKFLSDWCVLHSKHHSLLTLEIRWALKSPTDLYRQKVIPLQYYWA